MQCVPGGMVPLAVEYGADPRDANNVLQIWVIPVARAWQVGVALCHPRLSYRSVTRGSLL